MSTATPVNTGIEKINNFIFLQVSGENILADHIGTL